MPAFGRGAAGTDQGRQGGTGGCRVRCRPGHAATLGQGFERGWPGRVGSGQVGFDGVGTMLVEGVLSVMAGGPRAGGSSWVDPVALGRVLGLDRAPEVK